MRVTQNAPSATWTARFGARARQVAWTLCAAVVGACVYGAVYAKRTHHPLWLPKPALVWKLVAPPQSEVPTPSPAAPSRPAPPRPIVHQPAAALHPLPATGTVTVTVGGHNGQLSVDGQAIKTKASQTLELSPGTHTLTVQRGSHLQPRKVTVARGGTYRLDFPPPPSRPLSEATDEAGEATTAPPEAN